MEDVFTYLINIVIWLFEDISAYLIIFLSWIIGGIAGGSVAIGSGMIAIPCCTLVISPVHAVISAKIIGFISTLQLLRAYGLYSRWKDLRDLLVGCLPGVALGIIILQVAPIYFMEFLIAGAITIFIAFQFTKSIAQYSIPDTFPVRLSGGIVCGFISASVTLTGAPLGIYSLLSHWDPNRARGNMSLFYFFSSSTTLILLFCNTLIDAETWRIAFWGTLGSVLGQKIGIRIGKRINRGRFRKILIAFLMAADLVLIIRAVSKI